MIVESNLCFFPSRGIKEFQVILVALFPKFETICADKELEPSVLASEVSTVASSVYSVQNREIGYLRLVAGIEYVGQTKDEEPSGLGIAVFSNLNAHNADEHFRRSGNLPSYHHSFLGRWQISPNTIQKSVGLLDLVHKRAVFEGEVDMVYGKPPVPSGFGRYQERNGRTFVGEFEDGKLNGIGIEFFPQSSQTYIGQFKQGVYEGYGNMLSIESECYSGQFVNGKRHGLGEVYFASSLNTAKYKAYLFARDKAVRRIENLSSLDTDESLEIVSGRCKEIRDQALKIQSVICKSISKRVASYRLKVINMLLEVRRLMHKRNEKLPSILSDENLFAQTTNLNINLAENNSTASVAKDMLLFDDLSVQDSLDTRALISEAGEVRIQTEKALLEGAGRPGRLDQTQLPAIVEESPEFLKAMEYISRIGDTSPEIYLNSLDGLEEIHPDRKGTSGENMQSEMEPRIQPPQPPSGAFRTEDPSLVNESFAKFSKVRQRLANRTRQVGVPVKPKVRFKDSRDSSAQEDMILDRLELSSVAKSEIQSLQRDNDNESHISWGNVNRLISKADRSVKNFSPNAPPAQIKTFFRPRGEEKRQTTNNLDRKDEKRNHLLSKTLQRQYKVVSGEDSDNDSFGGISTLDYKGDSDRTRNPSQRFVEIPVPYSPPAPPSKRSDGKESRTTELHFKPAPPTQEIKTPTPQGSQIAHSRYSLPFDETRQSGKENSGDTRDEARSPVDSIFSGGFSEPRDKESNTLLTTQENILQNRPRSPPRAGKNVGLTARPPEDPPPPPFSYVSSSLPGDETSDGRISEAMGKRVDPVRVYIGQEPLPQPPTARPFENIMSLESLSGKAPNRPPYPPSRGPYPPSEISQG